MQIHVAPIVHDKELLESITVDLAGTYKFPDFVTCLVPEEGTESIILYAVSILKFALAKQKLDVRDERPYFNETEIVTMSEFLKEKLMFWLQ